MPFHRWRFALLSIASSCFVGSQVLVQADLAQAQYPPNLPDIKKAEWPSPSVKQKVFSDANSACQYAAGVVNDALVRTELLLAQHPLYGKTVYAAKCYLATRGTPVAFRYCNPPGYYFYVGDADGYCVSAKWINDVLNQAGYTDQPLTGEEINILLHAALPSEGYSEGYTDKPLSGSRVALAKDAINFLRNLFKNPNLPKKPPFTALTRTQARDLALKLGYKPPTSLPKAVENAVKGNPVYYNSKSNNYITPDIAGHRENYTWKMFDRYGNRLGTYSAGLGRRISD